MTHYKRFTPPPLPAGGTPAGAIFAALKLARLRAEEHRRRKAALEAWEAEGGHMAAANAITPPPPVLDAAMLAPATKAWLSRYGNLASAPSKP